MMDNFTYTHRIALRRFEDYVDICLNDAIVRCLPFYNEFRTTEMVVQDQVNYLDLALHSANHTEWTRSVKRFAHRMLPHWCKEYLVAEKIPDLRIAMIYDTLIMKGAKDKREYGEKLRMFIRTLFQRFERKTLLNASKKDPEQKKAIVEKYLRCYKRFSIDRFEIIFSDILNLCINPPLHCELTIDVLRTFCDTLPKQTSMIEYVSNAQCLETLILHAKAMRFNFWGLWTGGVTATFGRVLVPYFRALNNNPGFLKIILKYGFKYMTFPAQYRFNYYTLHAITFGDRLIIESVNVFSRAPPAQRPKMILILHIFKTFGNFGRTEYADDMLEILKYMIRSLPLPYVTPTDLYTTMEEAVIPEFEPELRRIVFDYSNADIFENDIKILMPRRLMHLCRVVVRKLLADNFMLPDGIQKLKISDELKAYLELKS